MLSPPFDLGRPRRRSPGGRRCRRARSRRALDVDLAVQVDLDRRVDREQRLGRQPAEVVGVLDRVQQRPAVGPVDTARAAGQVGADRLGRPAARAGRDRRPRRSACRCRSAPALAGSPAARSSPATGRPGSGRWARAGALDEPAIARCSSDPGWSPGSWRRPSLVSPDHHDLVGRQRRARVGLRQAATRLTAAIIAPASIAARCQDTSLPNLNPPLGATSGRRRADLVATARAAAPAWPQADRREAHLPGVRSGPQPPAGHERPDVAERGEVQPVIATGIQPRISRTLPQLAAARLSSPATSTGARIRRRARPSSRAAPGRRVQPRQSVLAGSPGKRYVIRRRLRYGAAEQLGARSCSHDRFPRQPR